MGREAPRTLRTLSAAYQVGVEPADYEVIAVDAGSRVPLDAAFVRSFGTNFRLLRGPDRPSPAAAINAAVRRCSSAAIALCIDGARMLSPGIIQSMTRALLAWKEPVVATLALHLGPKVQNESMLEGYDQIAEDRLLASVDWMADGYELFRIASLAGSSRSGWFLPISESNCLAMRRDLWDRLGGLDERFVSPGGGFVNLDLYRRACLGADSLVMLLGEGTFHQFHGGVATNVPFAKHPGVTFLEEYVGIRGVPFEPPQTVPDFLGSCPPQATRFLAHSLEQYAASLRALGQ